MLFMQTELVELKLYEGRNLKKYQEVKLGRGFILAVKNDCTFISLGSEDTAFFPGMIPLHSGIGREMRGGKQSKPKT